MVKMRPQGPLIGPCKAWAARLTLCGRQVNLMHQQRPSVNVNPVNDNRLAFDPKKKKVSYPDPRTKLENFSRSAVAVQPCQVKPVSINGQCSFRTQFWGNKIQNHILYPTPLIALEISDKGATVDIVFCPPSIYVLDLENSKNIIFFSIGPQKHLD